MISRWLAASDITHQKALPTGRARCTRYFYRPVSGRKAAGTGRISLYPVPGLRRRSRWGQSRIAVLLAEFAPKFAHRSASGLCARTTRIPGRPVPEPQEFYIDVDICMNCGFCAEYCPFDAIKMDHDYELSVYDRLRKNIYDKTKSYQTGNVLCMYSTG